MNFDDDFGFSDEPELGFGPPPPLQKNRRSFGPRDDRYGTAYGNYRGGYGPGGGFGPPSLMDMEPPPMMPPPVPLMMGRGFGPSGPPMRRFPVEEKAFKYLQRCGVGKEHLKNLPGDLLQLIEPQYCGLCATSFDSFANSRIHYLSKNHLKKMKKWVTQNSGSGSGYGGPRETMPLKSRDLYCELCDVHITSKSHADAHYAGKAHRAVVEGRRNPKNPFLLQRGQEQRLQQLIRREKKHLANEKPVEEDDEAKEIEEPRPLQPELYCEICKTSVTCTEQMTMHKNGKRHLSKEKQHILRMMKGEPAGGKSQGANNTMDTDDSNKDAEEENEEGEEEANNGDNDDGGNDNGGNGGEWGNGSGGGEWEDATSQ